MLYLGQTLRALIVGELLFLSGLGDAVKAALANMRVARPSDPRPFPPLGPLAGNFVSSIFGDAEVALSGDPLVLILKKSGAELELEPWDGDIFRVSMLPKCSSRAHRRERPILRDMAALAICQ